MEHMGRVFGALQFYGSDTIAIPIQTALRTRIFPYGHMAFKNLDTLDLW
jgi:hypothetical protein